MTAKQAARKIRFLGGEVTEIVLIRYGVSEKEAKEHMAWMRGRKGRKANRFFEKRSKGRKPILLFGHNTAK